MDKSFYDDHRGSKCPQRLFSKDVRKIKQSIDTAMDRYERTVSHRRDRSPVHVGQPDTDYGTEAGVCQLVLADQTRGAYGQ